MSGQQYPTRAQRREQRSSRRPKAIAGVTALVAVAGIGGYLLAQRGSDGQDAQANGSKACAASEISVAADPSLSGALTKALAGYHGAKDDHGCTPHYTVMPITNSELLQQMKGGSPSAQLWVADSPDWFTQASQVTKTTITPSAAFAATPVVISGPSDQLEKLGSPVSNWQRVVAAKPALTLPDASSNRASALALTRAAESLGHTAAAHSALGALATTTRDSIPSDAPYVTTEAGVMQWNQSNHGQLAETSLEDGSPLVTLQAAALVSGDAQTNSALASLTSYLSTGSGHAALDAAGYRDAGGKSAPSNAPQGSSDLEIGATPTTKSVNSALTAWDAATKPLRMTAVFDVSGSMSESVDGLSRAQAVSETALKAFDLFPSSTQVALWEFSTNLDGAKDYKQLVPMGPVSNASHLAQTKAAIKDLPHRLGGNTALYDTIWAAYQSAQKDYVPGSVSSVTVLTDGRNDDPQGGLSLDQLTQKLNSIKDPKRPVRVTTVTIGPDVDTAAMTQIAHITNGDVYAAKDPQDIGAVLNESMFDRTPSS